MVILRLFFLLLAVLVIRRFLLALRPPRAARPGPERMDRTDPDPVPPAANPGQYEGLTEQGIDDADFEEIP